MPTYEYKCENCGYQFDTIQSMKDAPLKECPECHENTLKKLISGGAGLIFKGSGFYLTDYKNKSENTTSSVSSSKGSSSSISSDKQEAKPAASKSESKSSKSESKPAAKDSAKASTK